MFAALARSCVLAGLLAGGALVAQGWTLRSLPNSPPGMSSAMAYDLQRGRCVLFGGSSSFFTVTVYQDTWEYDGSTWWQRSPSTVPPARFAHAMAYDWSRGMTVMFGGHDSVGHLGDTCEWDGTNWTGGTILGGPTPRSDHAMSFDAGRGVTVLFGGRDLNGDLAETWEWNGMSWTLCFPLNSPPPMSGHSMAYDLSRARTVMYGVAPWIGPQTWEYDGATWTQVVTDGGPPSGLYSMAYDTYRSRCVLIAGAMILGQAWGGVWEYADAGWQQLLTAANPMLIGMALVYDVGRTATVAFGGFDIGSHYYSDTWELLGSGPSYRLFGTGCDGSTGGPPGIWPSSMPALGGTTTLQINNLPSAAGWVYLAAGLSDQAWGALALPVDLAPVGLSGCRGYTSVDSGSLIPSTSGYASWSLAIPSTPALSGFEVFLQALSLDAAAPRPFPGAMSRAAKMRVQ